MTASKPANALIVGCGDVGCRLALRLATEGIAATGLVHSERSAAALTRLGIAPLIAELDDPRSVLPPLAQAGIDWLFHFAPPPELGVADPRLRRLLAALVQPPQRLIYLSTSAVYGDCDGRWIDEDEPLKPLSARGKRRLDAEHASRDYGASTGCEVLILRVPGIYGPGRLPIERLHAGTPVLRADESPYTNRIHADDLASAALLIAARGAAGADYNVCDGQPTTMNDYFRHCARLLDLPEPWEIALTDARKAFSPMLLSFLEESKRLDNRRLRELGWSPRYPDLAAGLPASLIDDEVAAAFRR